MGTNYYLRKKTEFNPLHRLPSTLGLTEGDEFDVKELVNGWMWNNKYYATLESLNSEYYQVLHIGKESYGWRFLLCTYPIENPLYLESDKWFKERYLDKAITSLDDWIELFKDSKNEIYTEYGDKVSAEDMINIISKRMPVQESKSEPTWVSISPDGSHAAKLVNGLLSHSSYTSLDVSENKFITEMPEDCTYDLVKSGNDSSSGRIFS